MVQKQVYIYLTALFLLCGLVPQVAGHGHDEDEAAAVTMMMRPQVVHVSTATGVSFSSSMPTTTLLSTMSPTPAHPAAAESYFAYTEFGGLMLAHIALMTVAWVFLLPLVVFLSISCSRIATAFQLAFLGVHSIALLLGAIYSLNTPNLYENNSHGKMGWIFTWVVIGQTVLSVLRLVASSGGPDSRNSSPSEEHSSSLPVTDTAMEEHNRTSAPSASSGHGRLSADSNSFVPPEPARTESMSSAATYTQDELQNLNHFRSDEGYDDEVPSPEKQTLLGSTRVNRVATTLLGRVSRRTLRTLGFIHNFIDRVILIMGFIAMISGAVVYGGVFTGSGIFSGLAHTIKGGIFFWYGLLALGRWMGCFAEWGWAWNLRPPVGMVTARQARMPSAEFYESFLIFFYGASNVFLEHLNAWGKAWSPMDLEHLALTVMFFGGGLCGMLIESTRIRDLLNSALLTNPNGPLSAEHEVGGIAGKERHSVSSPKSYAFSMNPLPAIIVLLLGLIMSSHHQNSMVSTAIHKQWGNLFIGAAFARGITYLLLYLSPPTSTLPSRPPSELVTAFCLISGGMIFMVSNRDTVSALENAGIHAAFPFTLTMGFTAMIMAWEICVFAVKGWAVRQMSRHVLH